MDFGVLILAGGRATRLPGKLLADADARPMLARVVANVRGTSSEVVVSTSAALAHAVAEVVDVRTIVDAEADRGPLGGMLASFAAMRSHTIFVVAGDAPFVDAAFAARLATAWRAGDEALVPEHHNANGAHIEPLAALYARDAFVRAGTEVLREGRGAIRLVLERLATRYVRVDDDVRTFSNINTPADYTALRAELAQETA